MSGIRVAETLTYFADRAALVRQQLAGLLMSAFVDQRPESNSMCGEPSLECSHWQVEALRHRFDRYLHRRFRQLTQDFRSHRPTIIHLIITHGGIGAISATLAFVKVGISLHRIRIVANGPVTMTMLGSARLPFRDEFL